MGNRRAPHLFRVLGLQHISPGGLVAVRLSLQDGCSVSACATREPFAQLRPAAPARSVHLLFTHGDGAIMSPVTQKSVDGLPIFYLKDLPPVATGGPRSPSRAFISAKAPPYVIVKTGAKEFDYPKRQENADTTYAGADGVPIGGTLWRTLLAWNLDDMNILLSGYLTDESRIILHRNIQERVRTIAPFLRLGRTGASSGHVVAGALVDCFQDLVRQRGPR